MCGRAVGWIRAVLDNSLSRPAVSQNQTDDDWEVLLPRLLLWAQRLHSRVLSQTRGAPTPADLVQDAITDVLSERRSRPPGVPLAVVLYGVIRSRVSHALSRAHTQSDPARSRFVGMEEAEAVHAHYSESPDVDDLRERVIALVKGDDILVRMVDLWFEDPALKASDLAAMLGVSPHDVYAAARRLRRTNVSRTALGVDQANFVPLWIDAEGRVHRG